jgi:hypothetical protein
VISLRYRRAREKEVEYAKQVVSSGDLKARGDAAKRDVEVILAIQRPLFPPPFPWIMEFEFSKPSMNQNIKS